MKARLSQLGNLLHLVDPNLPIGGFNHSNGLETFVQQGMVRDKTSLAEYIRVQLFQNWIYNDGAYVSLAFDAVQQQNLTQLMQLDRELSASKLARESREASAKLGMRLLKIFIRYAPEDSLMQAFFRQLQTQHCKGLYPIVFALVAASKQLDKQETLYAFYFNTLVGVVTNGVKLIPLSQMDGQDIVIDFQEQLTQAVSLSLTPDEEWLGASTVASDVRCMQHEQLYSRLYMS